MKYPVDLGVGLNRGWYEIELRDAPPDWLSARLYLDFGRGFSECHSIGLWRSEGRLGATIRMFKPVLSAKVQGTGDATRNLALSIRKIGPVGLWLRRLHELGRNLGARLKGARVGKGPNQLFRRYLRFRGFFSFPPSLELRTQYQEWIWRNEELSLPRDAIDVCCPLTVRLAVDRGGIEDLRAQLASALPQLRPGDRLVLHVPMGDAPTLRDDFESGRHSGVELVILPPCVCAVEALADAVDNPRREGWSVFLENGALFHVRALERLRREIVSAPQVMLFHGCHDVLGSDGERTDLVVRAGLSRDRLLLGEGVGPVLAVRNVGTGATRARPSEESQAAMLLRIATQSPLERTHCIAAVLGHQQSSFKAEAIHPGTSLVTLEACLTREGIDASVKQDVGTDRIKISYQLPEAEKPDQPLVSIIMPTKNKADLLTKAVRSILDLTSFSNFELIIIDHESSEEEALDFLSNIASVDPRVTVIPYSGIFNFSAICNMATRRARGRIIAFLNNDVELRSPGWIEAMAGPAIRDDIGCVGALLLYPDERVQHAGIALGIGGVAGHFGRGLSLQDERLAPLLGAPRNVSAVSAACMMIERDLFATLGGFNERLAVAFNDVDLCLRASEIGRATLWTPEAVFVHHESATRADDDIAIFSGRFRDEYEYMRHCWSNVLDNDPYYSSLLTLSGTEMGLRL